MKAAKITLAAVLVFGAIGGALAFKSNRLNKSLYFTTAGTTSCTFEVQGFATTRITTSQQPVTTIAVPLAEAPGICTTTKLYYTAE